MAVFSLLTMPQLVGRIYFIPTISHRSAWPEVLKVKGAVRL